MQSAIPSGETTVGILYCGDMGSAFGKLLRGHGLRVVTTCQGRSRATSDQALACEIEILPSLEDVVAQSHFIFSLVLPSAAIEVARQYAACCEARPEGSIFVEANSTGPKAIQEIESLMAGKNVSLVDATFNGSAHRLKDHGVLHLSGPEAGRVEALCLGLMRVNLLGMHIGSATLTKLLMSVLAKGLAGLFVEVGVLAGKADMLDSFLKSCGIFYPEILAAGERMLPTYTRHAARRVAEMREIEQLGQALDVQLGMTHEAGRWIQRIASVAWNEMELTAPADVPTIIKSVEKASMPESSRSQSSKMGGVVMISQTPKSAELHPGPGFRIRENFPRLDAELMKRFQEYEVPDISDALNRLYALDAAISCRTNKNHRLCGPACTVHVFPGDNLMVHKALDIARPNDIVVIDGHGTRGMNAVLGDIICTKAKHRGIAGFIVDGLVRDMPGIEHLDFPVFARGTTPVGPLHRGPGEINCPISCGGVVVNPGDLMVADESGIVVVPRLWAEEILQRLEALKAHQEEYLAAVRRGEFSNAWVDALLRAHDCPLDSSDVTASEILGLASDAEGIESNDGFASELKEAV